MNEYGLSEVPLSETFKEISTKGVPRPKVMKTINHVMNLEKLCEQDSVSLYGYVANIDGIDTCVNVETNEYSKTM